MDYNIGPRDRVRNFGLGIASGGILANDQIMEKVQTNINFRLNTLQEMFSGNTDTQETMPGQRRQVLRQRRLSLIGMDSSGKDTSTTKSRGDKGSGRITSDSSTSTQTASRTTTATTPSMSDVDKGTRARAIDRGFED